MDDTIGQPPNHSPGMLGAAALPVAIGSLSLLGWSLKVELLTRLVPTSVPINPLSSVCVLLLGFAFGFGIHGHLRLARAIAVIVVIIAGIKLADVTGRYLPVDQLLFRDRLGSSLGIQPNRMAPNSAFALALSAMALVFAQVGRPGLRLVGQACALLALLIASLTLVGYGLGVPELRTVSSFIPMSLPTALALSAIATGALALSRDVGLMVMLHDRGPAGTISRTVLPLAVAIPVAAALLRVWSQNFGINGNEAGIIIQAVVDVLITSALLVASVALLHRSDTARLAREAELSSSLQLNRVIAGANRDCISLLDAEGKIVFSNDATLSALGHGDAAALVGESWGAWFDARGRAARRTAFKTARDGGVGRVVQRIADKSGALRWFDSAVSLLPDSGRAGGFRYLVMSRDITEQRLVEEEVHWKAAHDELTGLPNRATFQQHLELQAGATAGSPLALLLLDIDNFRQVNDLLGHAAGDDLLRAVAARLREAVRKDDFVARLASDEFGIILRDVGTRQGVVAAADKIFAALREPWIHQGRISDCRVSIGASMSVRDGRSPTELLKCADIALSVAKLRGRGLLAVFQPCMRATIQKRARQIANAREALSQDLIVPYYQPKVELETGRLEGFEALLRWRSPGRGVQLPHTIDAAFSDLELAGAITGRMLASAFADMRRWLEDGLEFGHVAVNLTAADFRQEDFAERLLMRLDDELIPRRRLQIEVTETVFLGRGAEYVERALKTMSENGIRIALDDFGTGYASLSHLKQFPVDIVKLDRSFLRDFGSDQQNSAIIDTVVNLGHSLQLDVVAEGVENRAQESHLISRGCRFGQGFLYGKAVPAGRVQGLIRRWPGKDRE